MKKVKLQQFKSGSKLTRKELQTIKGGDDSNEELNEDGTPRTKDGVLVPPRN